MRILVAGGSGFLGRALTGTLTASGHHVTILTRQKVTSPDLPAPSPVEGNVRGYERSPSGTPGVRLVNWTPDGTLGPWANVCGGTDIVVNLAGESIAARRWSAVRKAELIVSRIGPTRSLVRFIEHATPRPAAFVSSSAIGYYGDRDVEPLTETSRDGTDFLSELAYAWEQAALEAAAPSTRVAIVRTGIVLDPREGALAKMLLPFRLFAGGPFGSGRQYMSWIHRDDWVAMVKWLIESDRLSGPFNAAAPGAVPNAAFAKTLGRVLGRPALMPAPGFALKLLLGEMAGPLLLGSQRVVPEKALQSGFVFRFPELEPALRDLLTTPAG
jgi:uncharacterized protein